MPSLAAALAWTALAQTPAPAPDPLLETARSWAIHYRRTLPDFLCTEFVRRYWQDTDVKIDTLTLQLGFSQQKPTYRLVARNNRTTHQTVQSLNGAFSSGEFGSALFLIFDAESAAAFEAEPPGRIRRQRVAVYAYTVPHARSHYRLQYGVEETIVAYHGRVYVNPDSGRVLRLTMDIDPPPDFPIQKTSTILDYDWRDIGGTQFLLPVRADVHTVERPREYRGNLGGQPVRQLAKTGTRYHNVVEFRDYHKFATESKLGFAQ